MNFRLIGLAVFGFLIASDGLKATGEKFKNAAGKVMAANAFSASARGRDRVAPKAVGSDRTAQLPRAGSWRTSSMEAPKSYGRYSPPTNLPLEKRKELARLWNQKNKERVASNSAENYFKLVEPQRGYQKRSSAPRPNSSSTARASDVSVATASRRSSAEPTKLTPVENLPFVDP